MDIELLKTFLEVNKFAHFGKAADALCLTQSAVSARIKLLEDALGEKMFERQRNRISLTPSGKRFIGYAESIVQSWRRARLEVGLDSAFTLSLSIAGLADIWDLYLLDWLSATRRHFPTIAFYAYTCPTSSLSEQVLTGQQDLGFLFEPVYSPELNSRFIRRIQLAMVSTCANLSAQQALQKGYVMVDWGTAYSILHAREYPDNRSSLIMSQGGMALSYILRNGGSAYLPIDWTAPLIDNGQLHEVNNSSIMEREINVIWRVDNERSGDIRKLLEGVDPC